MRKLFLILLLFPFGCCVNIFAQNWIWAKNGNGSGTGEGYSISTDASGNVYITGVFQSPSLTFGVFNITNTDSTGSTFDVFLTKYDASGNVLWAKGAGGKNTDICSGVSTDASGNVYITGYFYSQYIVFGNDTLTNTGNGNVFLVKYNTSGTVLWVKSSIGSNVNEGNGVTTDISGNVFITGMFNSSSVTFGTHILTNSGSQNIFLAKYDASGNALWATSGQGATSVGNSVATDLAGNVYLTGKFDSPTLAFGTHTITNSGTENTFLAKYNPSGSVIWAKDLGVGNNNMGNSVATDATNGVYITGGFFPPSITIGTYNLPNTGSGDVFLAKYDTSGNVLWAESAIGAGNDIGYSVATDNSSNIYLAGRFSYGTNNFMVFGSITLPYPSGGTDPMFIAKYDSNGKVLCASSLASGGDDNNGVATDVFGNAYVVGDFEINPFIVGSDSLALTGIEDIFVAKYRCDHNDAIDELKSEIAISVYPNPSNGIFSIKYNYSEKYSFQIFDISGRLLLNKTLSGNTETVIDANNLAPGVYNICLSSSIERTNKTLVIIK